MKKHNPTLYRVVAELNDCQYHSGNQLAAQLQLSRTAIWKVIQTLKEQYQIPIDAVKSKGYRLARPLSLLNPSWLKHEVSNLPGRPTIAIVESTTSTIDDLKQLPPSAQPNICLAEHMSQGVGRFARRWHAPFADNLYFSMSYHFNQDISQLPGLSLVTGLATLNTIAAFGIEPLQVKWPNDVLYAGQKISGNLLEISAEANHLTRVIISIGINVNMTQSQDSDINQNWTSMQQISGELVDKNKLALTLITQLLQTLTLYQKHGLAHFTELWHQHDALKDKTITLSSGKEKIQGQYIGISPQGLMIIKNKKGQLQSFSSGEASLHRQQTLAAD